MTKETYRKATEIINVMERIDEYINDMEEILKNNPMFWTMEVRRGGSYPPQTIHHMGLLPEFLRMTLEKLKVERDKLSEELEKL